MFYRDPIETTYLDHVSVYRMTHTETEWGEDIHSRELVYENIQCAVSFSGLNDRNKAPFVYIDMVTAKMEYHNKLFYNPRYEILPGDEIVHIESGREYLAGENATYNSHKELVMLRRWKDL